MIDAKDEEERKRERRRRIDEDEKEKERGDIKFDESVCFCGAFHQLTIVSKCMRQVYFLLQMNDEKLSSCMRSFS